MPYHDAVITISQCRLSPKRPTQHARSRGPPSGGKSLLCVALHPLFGRLLKLLAILLVFVSDGRLDGIVRVRFDHERLDQTEHGDDLVRRLPLVGTQQTQAHGAFVVVADIRMVDLGPEADDGGFERVLIGEGDLELEMSALTAA